MAGGDERGYMLAEPLLRDLDWPAAKGVAQLRHGFGGHPVHSAREHLLRSS
jgi:hypothetical protein